MIRGRCNCGAVSFEADGEVSDVFVCHCSICRRATGSNGIAVVIVARERFSWTSGEDDLSSWSKPDADWAMSFCRTCGSPLPGSDDETNMFLPAGLIDEGGEQLAAAHHIWVDSRAVWDEIGDKGRQRPEAFEARDCDEASRPGYRPVVDRRGIRYVLRGLRPPC